MATSPTRAILPLLLLLLGAGSIVVGAAFHSKEVLAQLEQKAPKPPAGLPNLAGMNRPAWMQPAPAPAKAAPRYIATWIHESEPHMVKEATVGGLALAEDGRIKRTYSGDTPSLCPT